MTKKDAMRIPDYLEHILEALKRIFDYVEDMDESRYRSLDNPPRKSC